jgi:hypothetical protein
MLLQYTRAKFDISLIPGNRDIISLFTYPLEICEKLNEKLSPNDVNTIRRSRLFTSAEDSLLLRGVVCLFLKISLFILRDEPIIVHDIFRTCMAKKNGLPFLIDLCPIVESI